MSFCFKDYDLGVNEHESRRYKFTNIKEIGILTSIFCYNSETIVFVVVVAVVIKI